MDQCGTHVASLVILVAGVGLPISALEKPNKREKLEAGECMEGTIRNVSPSLGIAANWGGVGPCSGGGES